MKRFILVGLLLSYFGSVFAQATPSKLTAISALDSNGDKLISQDEARKAGISDSVFKKMDKDGNGSISQAELTAYKAQQKVKLDSDRDGKISKDEALKGGMSLADFKIYDKDGSGFLDESEWAYWLATQD
jgi:hypothetical protein